MQKRAVLAFVLGFGCLPLGAYSETTNFGYDVLTVRTGIQLPEIPLTIQASQANATEQGLDYKQNVSPKFGLGAEWGDLATYVSFLSLEPSEDVKTSGKTDYFDLQFHLFFNHWGTDLYYQDFKGYYLSNTAEVLPAYYAANGNLIREDLRSFFLGTNVYYILHPDRLSIGSAISNTAALQSDGGSWFYMVGYSNQTLSSDSTLAPAQLATSYGQMGNIKFARFQTASLGAGYGYSWMFWTNWFFHLSLALNLGPQYQNYSTQDYGDFTAWKLSGKLHFTGAFGCAGKRYFGGLSSIADGTAFEVQDRTLDFNSVFTSLYFGMRFDLSDTAKL